MNPNHTTIGLDRRLIAAGQAGDEAARTMALKVEVAEAPPTSGMAKGSGARDVRLFRNGTLVRRWPGDVLNGQPKVTAKDGAEDPVETGDLRQAIGELVTCSRCVGTWVAGGLASTQIMAPQFGRLLTWSLATAGLNDWLQAGFTALANRAD